MWRDRSFIKNYLVKGLSTHRNVALARGRGGRRGHGVGHIVSRHVYTGIAARPAQVSGVGRLVDRVACIP